MKSLSKTMLLLALLVGANLSYAQLGRLKDKANKTVNKTKENTNSGKTKEEQQLEYGDMADKAMDEKKYKEAAELYQKAHDACPKDCYSGKTEYYLRKKKDALAAMGSEKSEEEVMKETNQVMGQLEAMKYKREKVPDNGITNDLHKRYIGKIVFANNEIPKTETSDAAFKKNFSLSEDIYARVYLPQCVTNEANDMGYILQTNQIYYRFIVDGQRSVPKYDNVEFPFGALNWANYTSVLDMRDKWTTFQLALSPKKEQIEEYPKIDVKTFLLTSYLLAQGKHKIKVELVINIPEDDGDYKYQTKFGKEKIIASGEFELNVNEQDKAKALGKSCPDLSWQNNKTSQVPNTFAMVDKSKRPNEKIVKVVLLDNDWTYKKNGYGVILSRSIKGAAIVQDLKTKLYYTIALNFEQQNTSSGGAQYGQATFTRPGPIYEASMYDIFSGECLK
ncbi:MAG: hypothetical protein SFU27_02075 [Thermonemataceae bacterium]|nr:hypothetical protein [Thermonemataceae bacterium]